MEKILVTGSTGFIGSHLIKRLSTIRGVIGSRAGYGLKYDVYCLERYVTGRYVAGEKTKFKTFFANLKDYLKIQEVLKALQPDYIIHLAAISAVSYSYDSPFEVMNTNLKATINLAESTRKLVPKLKQFLFAGSSEEYGNQTDIPIYEHSTLHPNSPYSVSKAAADQYLMYMHKAYGFPVTVLRNFNTYGRKRNIHFVVERIISQALNGLEIKLGNSTPIRDLMYVSDHVNSYIYCLNKPKAIGEQINFCTGIGVSIKELVEYICEYVDFKQSVKWNTIPKRPLDIDVLIGSNRKAHKLLGWKPRINLEKGLQQTINFMKNQLSKTGNIKYIKK